MDPIIAPLLLPSQITHSRCLSSSLVSCPGCPPHFPHSLSSLAIPQIPLALLLSCKPLFSIVPSPSFPYEDADADNHQPFVPSLITPVPHLL